MIALTERTKSNEEESSTLMALTNGDNVLDSCSERDFNDHGCSKTNDLFLMAELGKVTY